MKSPFVGAPSPATLSRNKGARPVRLRPITRPPLSRGGPSARHGSRRPCRKLRRRTLREFFVREVPRGVVRPIEVGEVAFATDLENQFSDAEIVERLPDSGVVGPRQLEREGDRVVSSQHPGQPQDEVERQGRLALLGFLDQRRVGKVDRRSELLDRDPGGLPGRAQEFARLADRSLLAGRARKAPRRRDRRLRRPLGDPERRIRPRGELVRDPHDRRRPGGGCGRGGRRGRLGRTRLGALRHIRFRTGRGRHCFPLGLSFDAPCGFRSAFPSRSERYHRHSACNTAALSIAARLRAIPSRLPLRRRLPCLRRCLGGWSVTAKRASGW